MTFAAAIQEALQQHPPHISVPSNSLSYTNCETNYCRHDLAQAVTLAELFGQVESTRPHEPSRPHE